MVAITCKEPCMQSGRFPLEDSVLFRLLQLEKEEVLRLKWIDSQKAGYDIGVDKAIMEWSKHRHDWIKAVLPLLRTQR